MEYDKLLSLAVREGLYAELKDDLTKLGEKIKPGKAEVLRKNKSEIKALLEEEISARYYFQRGRVESMIRNDEQLHKALNIKLIE